MLHETLLSFAEAARILPGGPVHLSTLHRWRLRGVNGVRLESVVVGGRRLTSHEALERFIARTTRAVDGSNPASEPTKARQRATEAAEAELARAGI